MKILVLNAFRHHWNSHDYRVEQAVTGSGAQRLSASLEFPQQVVMGLWHTDELCSTPFGIIGIPTNRRGDADDSKDVLNAFRHHWNSHGSARSFDEADGDVLNAFRHHWNSHNRFERSKGNDSLRAQRLSASLEFPRTRGKLVMAIPLECSTPFGIIGIPTPIFTSD